MIASVRGLAVLLVLAALLGVAVLVAAPESATVVERTFLDEKAVVDARLEIVHEGKPPVVLTPGEGRGWNLEGTVAYVPTTDAMTSALTGARWHRRGAIDPSWHFDAELRVGNETFRRGPPLAGTEQTWVAHGGAAYLVDSWVARAMFPEALALRDRLPFADAASASGVVGPNVRIEEGPYQVAPVQRWIAHAAYDRLLAALVAVELVSLDGITPGPPGRAIELLTVSKKVGTSVREAGTCAGDRVYLAGTYGSGCADAAVWNRALAAFEPFTKEDPALVDTHIYPLTPFTVTYPTGESIDLSKITDDLDPDRVAMMKAALRATGEVVPRPTGAPRTTRTLRRGDTELTLELFDKVVARKGEAFALKIEPAILAFLTKPASALRNTTLWREDVTTLSSFKLDGITYTRGQVIGEWTRTPAGTVDVALVEAVAESLASVRGVESDGPTAIAHRISVTFAPPVGGPKTHTLELGTGCDARVDGKAARLDLPLCMAVAALAGSR